jgi:hypothetical protein
MHVLIMVTMDMDDQHVDDVSIGQNYYIFDFLFAYSSIFVVLVQRCPSSWTFPTVSNRFHFVA